MGGRRFLDGLIRIAARFARDEDGVLPVLVLLFFVMLMAVGGLSIDIGRLYGERGQMQTYVDNAALAGATQLDGQTGSITRAFRAAVGDATGGPIVTGSGTQSIATVRDLSIERVTFLDKLGPNPGALAPTPATGDDVLCTWENGAYTPAGCDTDSGNVSDARYIEVRSDIRTVDYMLLPLVDFIGRMFGASAITASQNVQLRATAGYRFSVCDINPLMICNPSEPLTNTDSKYPYTPVIGQEILMKQSGNGSWVPGDFGLLQLPTGAGGICNGNTQGAGFITCVLALINPLTQCINESNGISVKPGQAETTSNGFNARFDVYTGSGNKFQNTPSLFGPSVNVTKGVCKINGGKCAQSGCPNQYDADPSGGALAPLPRDYNMQVDTAGTVRFGDNCWYAYSGQPEPSGCTNDPTYTATWPAGLPAPYWDTNHPGVTYPIADLGTNPTRYDVYRYEIDHGLIPSAGSTGENGAPMCAVPGVNNADRDRRSLVLAVVNCHAAGLSGNNNGSNLPVVAYMKMFLPEPVGLQADATGKVTGFSTSVNNVYGEVDGTVEPGDKTGTLHVLPVLYR